MLKIENLKVSIENKNIIQGLNLEIKSGQVHVLMGPNGSGKSTVAKVIAGEPNYQVTGGSILYKTNSKQDDLLEMDISERARQGIFLAFQYPTEIPGLNNLTFLRTAFNSICKHQGIAEMDEKLLKILLLKKLRNCKLIQVCYTAI